MTYQSVMIKNWISRLTGEDPSVPVEEPKPNDAYEAGKAKYEARTAELEAELAAIPEPPDLYRIQKNFQTGRFFILRWRKKIHDCGQVRVYFGPLEDFRSVVSGYDNLSSDFQSHSAAEHWLRAYIDPTTNQTGYGTDGKRLDPA